MAKGLTLQELQGMGAKPTGGLTLDQLQSSNPLDGFGTIDKRDWLDKTSDFLKNNNFPGSQIGAAVGDQLGALGSAAKFALEGRPNVAKQVLDSTPAPSFKKVVGDTVQSVALPVSLAGGGTTGTFVQRVLASTGLGAAISGGATAAKNGSTPDIAKSAAFGGAVGAALPIAGAGLRAIGDQIDNLPSRFIESALGRNKAVVLKEIQSGKESLTEFVLKKPVGTAETLIRNSSQSIDELGTAIKTKLAEAVRTTGGAASIGRDNFLDEIAQLPGAQGALMNRADVRGVIERLAPQSKQLLQKGTWSLPDANSLRQLLDRTLGDRGFLANQLSNDKEILRTFANTLREMVKTKAPTATRALFGELANEIQLRDALMAKLAQRAGNQVLSFGDFIGGGLGGIFGGGVPGAIAGVGARRVIESVPFKMTVAKAVSALTKAGPVLEQLAPAQQTALLTLFAELFSPDAEEPQPEALPQ